MAPVSPLRHLDYPTHPSFLGHGDSFPHFPHSQNQEDRDSRFRTRDLRHSCRRLRYGIHGRHNSPFCFANNHGPGDGGYLHNPCPRDDTTSNRPAYGYNCHSLYTVCLFRTAYAWNSGTPGLLHITDNRPSLPLPRRDIWCASRCIGNFCHPIYHFWCLSRGNQNRRLHDEPGQQCSRDGKGRAGKNCCFCQCPLRDNLGQCGSQCCRHRFIYYPFDEKNWLFSPVCRCGGSRGLNRRTAYATDYGCCCLCHGRDNRDTIHHYYPRSINTGHPVFRDGSNCGPS